MRTRRTVVALCVVFALAAAIYFVFKYESPVYIAPTLAAIPLAWSILVLVYRYWSKEHARAPSETPAPEQVAAAADWLASAVAGSWRKEAAARRIVTPAPVSVRWRWAGDLPPGEAVRTPVAGAGPPALPGAAEAERILTSGVVTKLHDELYTRLPRGRLVIVGGPGSGKTGAMILLLLEALSWREKLTLAERSKVPVPVLLTLAGWDPMSLSLAEWAASVLNRDYQALRAPRYGADAATALIASDRVALFLDGLDEMPDNLRAEALRRLNTEAPGLHIVLTSRPTEYADAIRQTPLGSAAVIELRPVRPAAAGRFLRREQPTGNRAGWERVADYITANPDSPAAKALDNPLALTMARDAYAMGDPTAIIDSASFPSEDDIAVHLTGQFLFRTYPDPRTRRWLGCLALHLSGRGGRGPYDLEWWRFGTMLNPLTRILAVALAATVAGTLVGWIIAVSILQMMGPHGDLAHLTESDRLVIALFNGLATGLDAVIVFGLAYAIVVIYGIARVEPSQMPLRLRSPRAMARALRRRKNAVRGISGFLGGLAGGIVYGIIGTLPEELLSNVRVPSAAIPGIVGIYGTIFGFAVCISFIFVSALEEPSDTGAAATPLSLLAESRSRSLLQMSVLVPLPTIVIATSYWMAADLLRELPDMATASFLDYLVSAFGTGIIGAMLYILAFTAWGQWLLLARIVLPLTGRLPWRLTTFLDDAYRRGVLRQAGAVYQFRHVTLRAYLSREQAAGTGGVTKVR